MHIVHLTSSTFYGGPERQMLGLAKHLPAGYRTSFVSFSEHGRCQAFLAEARETGFEAHELEHDTPHLRAAVRELTRMLKNRGTDILLTHGYKANLLGRIAARRAGIPIVAVSRGWTSETFKVRCYDTLDRAHLRYMDRVVCVSEGQAAKVRRLGVSERRLRVIRNAARVEAFQHRDEEYHVAWQSWTRGRTGILAAGRLSVEKGFMVLAQAARLVLAQEPQACFVIFGDGPERAALQTYINEHHLADAFHLVGFRNDLDGFLPWAEVVALSSFTEGLPNIVLEASSAGVPVVATAVGGTPEAIIDGRTGYLVPAGHPDVLAERLLTLVRDPEQRRRLGEAGQARMQREFSFAAQALAYDQLFAELTEAAPRRTLIVGGPSC